ncbi:MAG: hypothetical protein AAF768_08675 [Pseudomonadota bacterium]
MAVKKSVTKDRLWRWTAAIIATVVTSLIGLYPEHLAFGEAAGCSLNDVSDWQNQLMDPDEEIDPPYILEVTEAFILRCPDRPEIKEASRIAGVAAVRMGDAKRALAHFDKAGWIRDQRSLFAQAAAFLATGDTEMGWVIRDEILANWLLDLSRTPLTTVDTIEVQGGHIYAVNFTKIDAETGIRAAWVAVPDGPGWPATLSVGSDAFSNAIHKMRAGADAAPLRQIHLHRCFERKVLAQSPVEISVNQFGQTAQLALQAYLADPDLYEPLANGRINQCLMAGKLFPRPPR